MDKGPPLKSPRKLPAPPTVPPAVGAGAKQSPPTAARQLHESSSSVGGAAPPSPANRHSPRMPHQQQQQQQQQQSPRDAVPSKLSPRHDVVSSAATAAAVPDNKRGTIQINANMLAAQLSESAMVGSWLNEEFDGDASFRPLEEGTLFARVQQGTLLPQLLQRCFAPHNAAVASALAPCVAAPRNAFEQIANHSAALQAASVAGIKLVNIGPTDLQEGNANLTLAVLMLTIREVLLKRVKESAHLDQLREQNELLSSVPPEQLLLRWINMHLRNAHWHRVASDWGASFADSEAFLVLLNQLAPAIVTEAEVASALRVQDLAVRAEVMLELADRVGCRKFVTALGVSSGKERDKNIMFAALLFNKFPAIGPTVEQLQSQLAERQKKLDEERQKVAELTSAKQEAEMSLIGAGKRLQDIQTHAVRIEKQNEDLLEQIRKLKARIVELEAENARLNDSLNAAKVQAEKAEMDLAEAIAQHEAEREEHLRAVSEAHSSAADQQALAAQIERLSQDMRKEKLAAANFGKQVREANATVAAKTKELETTQARNAVLEQQVVTLQQRLAAETSRRGQEYQMLKSALSKLQADTMVALTSVGGESASKVGGAGGVGSRFVVASDDSNLSMIEPEVEAPPPPVSRGNKSLNSSAGSMSGDLSIRRRRETLGIRPDAQWQNFDEDDEANNAGGGPPSPRPGVRNSPRFKELPEVPVEVAEAQEAFADVSGMVQSFSSGASKEIAKLNEMVRRLKAEIAYLTKTNAQDLMEERIKREAERLRLQEEAEHQRLLAEEERQRELQRIKGLLAETQAEGYVFKRGKLLQTWKKNYVVMRENTIYFFRSLEQAHEPRPKPSSIISCDLIRVYEDTIVDERYECLEFANVEKDDDRIILGFSSTTEKQYWLKAIKEAKKKRVMGVGLTK